MTYIDLEAQVLRDGMSYGRPTRWSHGKASFGDNGEVATWKLHPGAANIPTVDYPQGVEVNVYVQELGGYDASALTPEPAEFFQWSIIRAGIQIAGQMWPQFNPGALWIPPQWAPGMLGPMYDGYTYVSHFPPLAVAEPLSGTFTLLLRAIRGA